MVPVKMTIENVFKLSVGLGVGISSLWAISPALAIPAPVFDPILGEISTSSPAGQPLRLPDSVPSDVELFPSVTQQSDTLVLRLEVEPDCSNSDCLAMGIGISTKPFSWPPEEVGNLTTVDLGNNIQGYSIEGGGFRSVLWVQDESLYTLTCQTELFSLEDTIAMAGSMVSAPTLIIMTNTLN